MERYFKVNSDHLMVRVIMDGDKEGKEDWLYNVGLLLNPKTPCLLVTNDDSCAALFLEEGIQEIDKNEYALLWQKAGGFSVYGNESLVTRISL